MEVVLPLATPSPTLGQSKQDAGKRPESWLIQRSFSVCSHHSIILALHSDTLLLCAFVTVGATQSSRGGRPSSNTARPCEWPQRANEALSQAPDGVQRKKY